MDKYNVLESLGSWSCGCSLKPLIPPAMPDDLELGHFKARWMLHVPLDIPEQFWRGVGQPTRGSNSSRCADAMRIVLDLQGCLARWLVSNPSQDLEFISTVVRC